MFTTHTAVSLVTVLSSLTLIGAGTYIWMVYNRPKTGMFFMASGIAIAIAFAYVINHPVHEISVWETTIYIEDLASNILSRIST